MKRLVFSLMVVSMFTLLTLISCEKEEDEGPDQYITFKVDGQRVNIPYIFGSLTPDSQGVTMFTSAIGSTSSTPETSASTIYIDFKETTNKKVILDPPHSGGNSISYTDENGNFFNLIPRDDYISFLEVNGLGTKAGEYFQGRFQFSATVGNTGREVLVTEGEFRVKIK